MSAITFFLHHERYHLLLSSRPLLPSFGLASAIMVYYIVGFAAAPLREIIPPIWPHRRASPRDIIIYLASPLRLSGDIKWANPQAPLPHRVLGELFGCPFSLDHRHPSSGTSRRTNLYSQIPILYLCRPSLGSQGKNMTLLWGPSSSPSIPTLHCSLSIHCKPSVILAPLVASTMPQVFLSAKSCHALT